MRSKMTGWFGLAAVMLSISSALAQDLPDTMIQLKGAVTLASQRYHLLQARKYESAAAAANVDVVKYSRLPTIDATYQAGIATANNLTGMFYPNGILPISGPPSATNKYDPATGSAAGLLLNWQALTFGERSARIGSAVAEANAKRSEYQNDLFGHTINVISNYLDVLLAYDQVNIQQRNIERVTANLQQSRTLTRTGIKAGVDTALFLSELSKAKVELFNAQKQLETKQWLLASLVVLDALPIPTDTAFLNGLPPITENNDTSFSGHPLIQYAQSQFSLSQSKEKSLKRSFLPKLTIWGTGFARGSGFEADGSVKTWDGLGLSRYNYGAGLQLAFPIMKYGEVKRQVHQQNLLSKAAQENLEESRSALSTRQRIANTTLRHSLLIAAETKEQLRSGEKAFYAMQIRYSTGLVNFSDLIQTQYNLLRAELDVKQAYWDAWKALLLEAAVKGDVNVFLNEIK